MLLAHNLLLFIIYLDETGYLELDLELVYLDGAAYLDKYDLQYLDGTGHHIRQASHMKFIPT